MSYNHNTMGRKRKHNKNYPMHLHLKGGWFYFVARLNGKYKWFPLKTQDEGVALQRWANVESAIRQEFQFDASQLEKESTMRIPFSLLVKRFLNPEEDSSKEENKPPRAASTQRNYERMSKSLIERFKDIRVDKIKRQDIIRYHDSLRKTPYEANRRIALLRLILKKAFDWGYLNVNPAAEIEKYKEKKHKLKLTEDMLFNKIYPVAKPMLRRAIMFAFHLVQHENEVKKLQMKDINFAKKTISFTRQKTREEIVINYSENVTLLSYLEHLKSTRRELSPYLICHKSRKGWVHYSHFRSMWTKALERAGYHPGEFKFKEIRHLSNTLMKDANISVDKRKAMTGHKTIQANEAYTHPTGTDTIEAGRALSVYRPEKF